MSESTNTRYDVYANGSLVEIEGGLSFRDKEVKTLEVTTTANGKEKLEFSIAVNAGSKKVDGNWQDVTEWNNITIYDWHSPNAKALMDFIRNNTNDKLKFYKGNRVKLLARVVTELTQGNDGKTYLNRNIVKFYDLTKIPMSAKKSDDNGNGASEQELPTPQDNF